MKTTNLTLIAMIIAALFALYGVYKERDVPQDGRTLQIQGNVALNPVQNEYGLEELLDAIEQIESGGNPNAVGDNGKAVGSFQIHKIYVDDVNRIAKLNHIDKYSAPIHYKYYHRESPISSRFMVKRYLEYYATKKRIGKEPTLEDMARIHNGGPNGWKKESTKPYWEKVKRALAGVN